MMLRRLRQLGRYLFGRTRLETDLQREVGSHLQIEIDRRVAAGQTPDEARAAALRDFGSVTRVAEGVRDARGVTFWDDFVQDVRFGVRTLRHSPGYTAAAILILGLGIGVNTAMFSVINGVLLAPLPFKDDGELVLIQQAAPASNVANASVSIAELYDYRARLNEVRDLVEYHGMSFVLLNQGEPDRVDTGVVSANFFDMLGIKPALGRTFVEKDEQLGADAVLVLSHEYWQQKFGGDPGVIGKVLEMNNRPHTVVGVLPPFPQYPAGNDVYMATSACPFRARGQQNVAQNHRAFAALSVFGRLAPGRTAQAATAAVAAIARSFPRDYPSNYQRAQGLTGAVLPLKEQLITGARPMLAALAGATLLVLFIACANVANLAIARTSRRRRELAVRTALGAGRGRLFRQLVTESVIVAIAGGVLGLALAALSLDLLVGFVGRFTARTGQIAIDARVLWFTLGASLVTGIVFGAAPALAARRKGLVQAVREGSAQGGDSRARRHLRSGLVVAQVAVSFVLLVGAALLLESFYRLSSVPLGYDTRQVITANIRGNFTRFATPQQAIEIQSGILQRLRATPGVAAAAVTASVPLSNIAPGNVTVRIEGLAGDDTRSYQVDPNVASDGYFETLGVPTLVGRTFEERDAAGTLPVAVINASMAKFWNGASPIGTRFQPQVSPAGQEVPWFTVIGVVGDFRLYSADTDIVPMYYTTFRQPLPGGGGAGRLIVRAAGDTRDLPRAIKAAVHGTDAQIPVEEVQTVEELRSGQLAVPGLTAALLVIFAGVALLVTLAGIAGVIGTTVSQRTREFGLRMALGASRGSVLQLVLGQGVSLAIAGVVLGVGGAAIFTRLLDRFLFATRHTDVQAYAIVAVVFLVATLIAAFGPARRATSIDPLRALRTE
jgi:predicted permease